MSSELPEGWEFGRVSDLVQEVKVRVDPQNAVDPDTPYLGLENIGQGTGTVVSIGRAKDANSLKTRFEAGDILFGKLRPNLKKVARPNFDGICSTDIAVLRANPEVDPNFAFSVLSSNLVIEHAVAHSAGTKMPRTHARSILSFKTAFPLLGEQRQIAEVLLSVSKAIGYSRMVAEAAQQASQTLRHELLGVSSDGEIADLPAGWELLPLEALATVERGKFSIRPRNDPRFFGGDMPFVQTGDITAAGDYLVSHTQTLNELGVKVSRVFPAGTIMTTIAANIGDFSIATYPVACPDSVVGIEAREGINTFWLYSVLSCFKVALDRAATQNAQKNINLQTLRPLLIPVPPSDLMNSLAETLEATAGVAREANVGCCQIERLRAVVVGDLLSGRVRVPA